MESSNNQLENNIIELEKQSIDLGQRLNELVKPLTMN